MLRRADWFKINHVWKYTPSYRELFEIIFTDDSASDLFPRMSLREPRYGWQGFDKNHFNDELKNQLDDLLN